MSDPGRVERPGLIQFYSDQRNAPGHLYHSERRFLPWLAKQSHSVLDVGCALGGFAAVWKALNPEIHYVGADLSSTLIQEAHRLQPTEDFLVANGTTGIPFTDSSFDVVAALGWLHFERRYPEALQELWRVASSRLIFDVRLVGDGSTGQHGLQQVPLHSELLSEDPPWPYLTVAWKMFADLVIGMQPSSILVYGYEGYPGPGVVGIDGKVCFAVFVLEKSPTSVVFPEIIAQLPWPVPSQVADRVVVLSPEELDVRVPSSVDLHQVNPDEMPIDAAD